MARHADKTPIPDDEVTDIRQLEPLGLLKPKAFQMNGLVRNIRRRMGGVLKCAGILAASGAIAGTAVGTYANHRYREWSGYDPNPPAPTAKAKADPVEEDKLEEESNPTESGPLDRAKKAYKDAKKWTGETVDNAVDKSKVAQRYREVNQEYSEFKRMMLEAGDKVSFWLPFLLAFLAAAMLARKILKIKKLLGESVDPGIERALGNVVTSLNRVIERVNTLTRLGVTSAEEAEVLRTEIEDLTGRFESATATVKELTPESPQPRREPAPLSQPPRPRGPRVPRAAF